jgi:hypothetical protein
MPRAAMRPSVDVDRVLHDRIVASTDRIIKMMPLAAKTAAITSIDVASLVLNIARSIPAVEASDPSQAEDITNAIAFKRRMIEGAGGAFDAEAVRKLLGHKTVQAVYKAAREHRLLMVDDNGSKLFPAFQFDGGAVRPATPHILAASAGMSGWAIVQFFVSGDAALDGARPLDLLRGDEADVERQVSIAQARTD